LNERIKYKLILKTFPMFSNKYKKWILTKPICSCRDRLLSIIQEFSRFIGIIMSGNFSNYNLFSKSNYILDWQKWRGIIWGSFIRGCS